MEIEKWRNGNEKRNRKSKKIVVIIFLVKNGKWLKKIYQKKRTNRIYGHMSNILRQGYDEE